MRKLRDRIVLHLRSLLGLRLTMVGRAADMGTFSFRGRRTQRGKAEEYTLHVQCPWRIEGPRGIVTGRGDLWEPSSDLLKRPKFNLGKWKYDDGNRQDEKILQLFKEHDWKTRSAGPLLNSFVVTGVSGDNQGGAVIRFSGRYRLVMFPHSSRGEEWRLIPPKPWRHFVVGGEDD